MEKEEINRLIDRYLGGSATDQERAQIESWYNSQDQSFISELKAHQIESDLSQVESYLQISSPSEYSKQPKPANFWLRITAAAAILCAIAGTAYFFYHQNTKTTEIANTTDIAPGKIGATLTLSSGKKIKLSEATKGELAKEAGLVISKTADGQLSYSQNPNTEQNRINTLSTARGETYMIILSDQTKVWLNAASSLTYSASLNENGKRRVKLIGEAYFEVAKDKAHPFIVESARQQVEVLGTHFNINSYSDEPSIKTTLIEGSVKVTSNTESKILKPGQQADLNTSINISEVDTETALAWKNGYFNFDHDNLESILKKVSRWYDVEIEYKNENLKSQIFSGTISRFKNVSQILDKLELTRAVQFKIKGKTIIVSN